MIKEFKTEDTIKVTSVGSCKMSETERMTLFIARKNERNVFYMLSNKSIRSIIELISDPSITSIDTTLFLATDNVREYKLFVEYVGGAINISSDAIGGTVIMTKNLLESFTFIAFLNTILEINETNVV